MRSALEPPETRGAAPNAAGATVGVRIAIGAAVLYLGALAIVLLSPDHLDGRADLLYRVVLRLFPSANERTVDFGLNVSLFLPFGVILAPLLRRHIGAALAVAWGVPALVEIVQAVFLPGRVSSVFDVVANAAGSLTAALLVEGVRRRLTR